MLRWTCSLLIVAVLAGTGVTALADVKLPRIFGDRMILQRDRSNPVWGKANPGQSVTVSLAGKSATAKADAKGNWRVTLPAMKAGGVQYLFNLAVDPDEANNLAGVAGYESITCDLVSRLLAHHIGLHQRTHVKEKQRLQRVHVP
jgi:hypothetical protein